MSINNATVTSSKEVKLLGLTIDCKLSFSKHISNICKQAANKLNAIKRFQKHISEKTKRQLAKTFVLSYFNFCPLVWHHCGNGDMHNIERMQERVLRFMCNEYTTDYSELLKIQGESTMYIKRLRLIAQEVYKSISGLNPEYMHSLLTERSFKSRRPLDIYIPKVNQVTYGYRSYRFQAPTVWNSLPVEIRSSENYPTFKKLIQTWIGPSCRCTNCLYNSDPI